MVYTEVVVRKDWLHACGWRDQVSDCHMSVRAELGPTPSGCMMYEVLNPITGRVWVVAAWRLVACSVRQP